jgi:hypothetical protein
MRAILQSFECQDDTTQPWRIPQILSDQPILKENKVNIATNTGTGATAEALLKILQTQP